MSEMEFGERGNVFGLLGEDDAVNLHVAGVGGTHATFENALHLFLFYGTRLEFADAAMVVDEVDSGHCFKFHVCNLVTMRGKGGKKVRKVKIVIIISAIITRIVEKYFVWRRFFCVFLQFHF